MARQARLCIPGHPHLVSQRGHNRQPVFVDEADRRDYLVLLGQAAKAAEVALHAYGLSTSDVVLLATPAHADGLSLMMQSVGRRYGMAFNRRHGRSGSLWDGRFRAVPIEAEPHLLAAMRFVEGGMPPREASSAEHHLGRGSSPIVSDHALYWALGNTPFDREMKYRAWTEAGPSAAETERFERALAQGWPVGSAAYLERLAPLAGGRRLAAKTRGRPPKAPR